MSEATASVPVVVGRTLSDQRSSSSGPSRQTLVSVKYNFKAPSIPKNSVGLLHCPKHNHSEWLLEYAAGRKGSDQENGAHGFTGTQSTAKDIDCILVWDDEKQAYILDQLASSISLKLDRGHTKLTKTAQDMLPDINKRRSERKSGRHSALGIDLPDHELESSSRIVTREDEADGIEVDPEDHESDDFARQLQYDLEAIGGEDEEGIEDHTEIDARRSPPARNIQGGPTSPMGHRTGLGLIGTNGMQEDVITPRGSPFIDRSTRAVGSAILPAASAMRATPAMSPVSVATSPRTTGLESSLSSTWRPPAQRSNVALAFDDEEDDDDEDESDEDDDDEEEDEDDDDDDDDDDDEDAARGAAKATSFAVIEDDEDDLDAFARQLEGSLMEPPTPIEEKQAKQPRPVRRSSTRGKK